MAEIRIKKKKSPVWAWIIALIVVVVAGYLVYTMVVEDDTTTPANTERTVETTNSPNNY